jgi:hypothetical protein
MSTPKKRSAITLEVKKAIIEAANENNNQSALAKQFNIPRTTISGILKERLGILKVIENGGSAKPSRLTPMKHKDTAKALVLWIKQLRSSNLPVNGELIKVIISFFCFPTHSIRI